MSHQWGFSPGGSSGAGAPRAPKSRLPLPCFDFKTDHGAGSRQHAVAGTRQPFGGGCRKRSNTSDQDERMSNGPRLAWAAPGRLHDSLVHG